jgi:predicted Zn-dependent peptidase
MAYEAEREKMINALTTKDVQAALQKHIDLKKLVFVRAGDFETKPDTKIAAP